MWVSGTSMIVFVIFHSWLQSLFIRMKHKANLVRFNRPVKQQLIDDATKLHYDFYIQNMLHPAKQICSSNTSRCKKNNAKFFKENLLLNLISHLCKPNNSIHIKIKFFLQKYKKTIFKSRSFFVIQLE